jgi:hypothetical protein
MAYLNTLKRILRKSLDFAVNQDDTIIGDPNNAPYMEQPGAFCAGIECGLSDVRNASRKYPCLTERRLTVTSTLDRYSLNQPPPMVQNLAHRRSSRRIWVRHAGNHIYRLFTKLSAPVLELQFRIDFDL